MPADRGQNTTYLQQSCAGEANDRGEGGATPAALEEDEACFYLVLVEVVKEKVL